MVHEGHTWRRASRVRRARCHERAKATKTRERPNQNAKVGKSVMVLVLSGSDSASSADAVPHDPASMLTVTERLLKRLSITSALVSRQRQLQATSEATKALSVLRSAQGETRAMLEMLVGDETMLLALTETRDVLCPIDDGKANASFLDDAIRSRLSADAEASKHARATRLDPEVSRLARFVADTLRVCLDVSRDEANPLQHEMRTALEALKPAPVAPGGPRPPAIALPPSPAIGVPQIGVWQFGPPPPPPPSCRRRRGRCSPPPPAQQRVESRSGARPSPLTLTKRKPSSRRYLSRGMLPGLAPVAAGGGSPRKAALSSARAAVAPHVGGPALVLGLKPPMRPQPTVPSWDGL